MNVPLFVDRTIWFVVLVRFILEAEIVPALKLPLASRRTMVENVFALVAALAKTVAASTFAAVCPPTLDVLVEVVALPLKLAVIVPAVKLPLASLATIASTVFALVAVVAELATFPAVDMVCKQESGMVSDAISDPTTKELDKTPEAFE